MRQAHLCGLPWKCEESFYPPPVQHLRRLLTAPGALVALAAVTLGACLTSPAEATISDQTHRTGSVETDSSLHTLLAGQALVAGTTQSALRNGWYSLDVWSGIVEVSETIPVAGSDGPGSSTTGTWFRNDPTGRFQAPHHHTRLRLRDNGDLVLITSGGRRLWHSGTRGSGAVRLTLHRSGNLALHAGSGKVVWSSHSGQVQMSGGMRLEPGHQLRDASETAFPGGQRITLTMQRNGNLVHRCGSQIDWQSHTHVAGSTLRMYRNGALRVVTPKGRTVWASGSGGDHDYAYFNGKRMEILADGIDLIWYARTDWQAC